MTTRVAIIGSGNIGTDLLIKVHRLSGGLEVVALAGVDPDSDGLARAQRLGVATTAGGVSGLMELPEFTDVEIVFDATSARAHIANDEALRSTGRRLVDLTPAAIGPYVVPVVNIGDHHTERNVNMVTCGGQATIPIVAAVSGVVRVRYAEIVASIASRSAGPGTRANIDEFTETTARGLETVGGAERGKAIIVLNPAEPPLIMRDTVHCLVPPDSDQEEIRTAVAAMVARVAEYVPGYRLKQEVQFTQLPSDPALATVTGEPDELLQVSVFLEVEGAAHYLPSYAGNLDIMTSAALRVGEQLATREAVEVAR